MLRYESMTFGHWQKRLSKIRFFDIVNITAKMSRNTSHNPAICPVMSLEYFNSRWKKEDVFGKSWMTLEEIIACNEDDSNFYLNEQWFTQYSEPDKVRVIFWFVNFSK